MFPVCKVAPSRKLSVPRELVDGGEESFNVILLETNLQRDTAIHNVCKRGFVAPVVCNAVLFFRIGNICDLLGICLICAYFAIFGISFISVKIRVQFAGSKSHLYVSLVFGKHEL